MKGRIVRENGRGMHHLLILPRNDRNRLESAVCGKWIWPDYWQEPDLKNGTLCFACATYVPGVELEK